MVSLHPLDRGMRLHHPFSDGGGMRYFSNTLDLRMGAPHWNAPWTPPDGFPRAKFFNQLKSQHPKLSDLDAAFLLEATIFFFDDLPVKEPKRTKALLGHVQKEVDLYCTWDTATVKRWCASPASQIGISRWMGRNAWLNDRWLLKRIRKELA